ncbi:hypothetical protein ACVWW4_000213 [Bradyrhizobium sp. LB7.1]
MIGAHARTLAFMPQRFLARQRADLLLAVGLDNIDFAVSQQGSIDAVIEPCLWQLSVRVIAAHPFRLRSPAVLQPLPITIGERQSHSELLTTSGSTQHDGNLLLLPDVAKCKTVHNHSIIQPMVRVLRAITIATRYTVHGATAHGRPPGLPMLRTLNGAFAVGPAVVVATLPLGGQRDRSNRPSAADQGSVRRSPIEVG